MPSTVLILVFDLRSLSRNKQKISRYLLAPTNCKSNKFKITKLMCICIEVYDNKTAGVSIVPFWLHPETNQLNLITFSITTIVALRDFVNLPYTFQCTDGLLDE